MKSTLAAKTTNRTSWRRSWVALMLALSLALTGVAAIGTASGAPDAPVIVYYALWLPHAQGLVPVHALPPPAMEAARGALHLLLAGPPPGGGLSGTVPAGTSVLNLVIDEEGLATVDFSAHLTAGSYGSIAETMLVASIVNTLTALPEVNAVRILVAGQTVESLGGHVLLTAPLAFDHGAIYQRGLPDLEGHWAEGQVSAFCLTGIISGYPEGDFRPERTVSREEFVKMLVLTRKLEPVQAAQPTFADVALTRWSSGHIEAAVAAGIILPADYGAQFRPGEPPTRREIAVMLVRAVGQEALAESLTGAELEYTDVAGQPAWAIGYLAAVTELGLMRGYPDGSFGPALTVKRSEAVTVLSRILSYGDTRVIMVRPVVNQIVGPQVLVWGASSTFEATVQARVNSPDGSPYSETYVTATAGGPFWGVFAALLATPQTGDPFTVETYEESAKDGSVIHLTTRQVQRQP